ncbi:MAG: tetratricopeptide repeat protein, partial [Candidatus Omnitrophica bacterium]|nr:tetratricopeptide repeat protein [Candidatus Omnitrophota bacterium]
PASAPALEALLKLGEIYKGRGDYTTAVDYFQAATKHAEDKAFKGIALYKQAETAFLSADYEVSADLFAEVVDLQPDPALVEDAVSNLLLALFNVPAYNAVIKRAAHYEKLLTPNGRLFDVRYVTARSLKQLGQYDTALEEINKAEGLTTIKATQKNKAIETKVEILFLSRKYADVIALIDTAWSGQAEFLEKALFFKAESEYSLANFQQAHEWYSQLLAKFPQTEYQSEALYGLAHAKNALGMEAEAAQLFEDYFATAEDQGKKKEALFNQILLKSKVKDYERAIKDSNTYLKTYPDDKNVARVRFLLGSMYSESKQYDMAIGTFEHIVQRDLENPKRLESIFLLAYNLQLAQKIDDALAYYQQVPKEKGNAALYYSARKNMALIHLERKDFNKAILLLKEIIDTYDENDLKIDMYLWIAEKSLEAKSYDTVLNVLEKAESKAAGPEDRQALAFFRGAAFQRQNQCQNAIVQYDQVVRIENEQLFVPKAYLGKAQCLMIVNKIDEAKEVLDKLLLGYGDEAEISLKARFEMGQLLEKRAQPEEAAKFYMLVAVLYSDPWYSPESLYRAGHIFEQLNKLSDARNVYQEIIQLYTKSHRFEEAQKRLAALSS